MKKLLCACLLFVTLVGRSQGYTEALANYSSPVSSAQNGTVGFIFRALGSITVTQLGIFSDILDQLGPNVEMGVWNSSGVLITSVKISTTSPLINATRYVTLDTPLSLQAQQVYTIGAYLPTLVGVNFEGGTFGGTCTVSPSIEYLGYASAAGSSMTLPVALSGAETIIPGVVNFIQPGTVVPEPATCSMLFLGLCIIAARRRL